MAHAHDSIRAIAKGLVGAATDRQITTVARNGGCRCTVVDDLNSLDVMDRFRLLKFMINEGQRVGYTVHDMARMAVGDGDHEPRGGRIQERTAGPAEAPRLCREIPEGRGERLERGVSSGRS